MNLLDALLRLPDSKIVSRSSSPSSPSSPADAAADPATEALRLLERLKCFTLPRGRMEAARQIVCRLEPLLHVREIDPVQALAVLRQIERDLIALGGAPDPELGEVVETVRRAFPSAGLVEIKLQ